MIKTRTILVCSLLGAVIACGGGDGGPSDPLPPCPSGNCGKASFRRAVPTADKARITPPTGSSARRANRELSMPSSTSVSRGVALEAIAPAIPVINDHVAEINKMIDEVFGDLDGITSETPEIQTDTLHQWRIPSEVAGYDAVLQVAAVSDVKFDIDYFEVPTGEDPIAEDLPILYGEVDISTADLDYLLVVDLDAATLVDPAFNATGEVAIAAMPLAGGEAQFWYDYKDVAFDDTTPLHTSRTTAWTWDSEINSAGLEFVIFDGPIEYTMYARWDEDGGRYDHHAAYNDVDLGPVDEISTDCWTAGGGETFYGWAVIDQSLSYYGELDGEEAECEFLPVEDHPAPGADFDNLPADGEWELLELLSYCDVSTSCEEP
ncbi:MAG: hypothetical protein AB7O24_27805 [Kofleriaceae bacterium]